VESGGIEAIVMTASGCGVHVRAYDRLLRDDPVYAEKAARVVALVRDIGEVLAREDLSALKGKVRTAKVAFHAPCTLQHGLRQAGEVERLLRESGLRLTPVPQPHLCCGSAGSYSILQPGIAKALRAQKLAALESGGPDLIATANIGCLLHLAAAARVPVVHWVELLAPL
jgi:glycolate oxidase iron-sulfur subunit